MPAETPPIDLSTIVLVGDRDGLPATRGGTAAPPRRVDRPETVQSRAGAIGRTAAEVADAYTVMHVLAFDGLERAGEPTRGPSGANSQGGPPAIAAKTDEVAEQVTELLRQADVACRSALRLVDRWRDHRPEQSGTCAQCLGPIYGKRADARFCSDACRQGAHRERRRERHLETGRWT